MNIKIMFFLIVCFFSCNNHNKHADQTDLSLQKSDSLAPVEKNIQGDEIKKNRWCIYKQNGTEKNSSFDPETKIVFDNDSVVSYFIGGKQLYTDTILRVVNNQEIILRHNKYAIIEKNDSANFLVYYPVGLDGGTQFFKKCVK